MYDLNNEMSLGSVYDEISEWLQEARRLAVLGQTAEANTAFRSADFAFKRFQDSLRGYPGYSALEYAFQATLQALTEAAKCPSP